MANTTTEQVPTVGCGEDLVDLSVSGTHFTVRKELLTETDWILAKVMDDELPWGCHDKHGRYFLDADPIAFRWILHYLRCKQLPSEVTMSLEKLETIRVLADFLCFQELIVYVRKFEQQCRQAKARVEEEMTAMEIKVRELRQDNHRLRNRVAQQEADIRHERRMFETNRLQLLRSSQRLSTHFTVTTGLACIMVGLLLLAEGKETSTGNAKS